MILPIARNARAEANAMLPDGYEARVLEPSPPPNQDPQWFADDPTDPSGAPSKVVSPTSDGDITWDELTSSHPDLANYAADHWLGAWKRLRELPSSFTATRNALHQVAFFAVAPRRHAANGKIGLRYTHRGFGTPFFGDAEQVRIEAGLLVYQKAGEVSAIQITTTREAAQFLGIEYVEEWFEGFHDPLGAKDPDQALAIDSEASLALGDWFGFSYSVLEEARRLGRAEDQVSRVQLWPEHFDPAFEMGDADLGQRASFGASPGDEANPEPYLYVAPWGDIDGSNPYWNGSGFNGASLGYSELLASTDQRKAALDFIAEGYQILTGLQQG